MLVLWMTAEPHSWDAAGFGVLTLGAMCVVGLLVLLLVIVSLVKDFRKKERD